jgi:hypothetical protein
VFNLADQLAEQVEAHLNRLRRNGWLTFKGPDAVELLRRVVLVNPQPHLIAHCHYNLAARPQDYEFFIPTKVEVIAKKRLVKITGRCHGTDGAEQTLFWHPEKSADPSGKFLSSISTLASCFPESAIAAVEVPKLVLPT